ncbi:hypothetical protein GGTG_00247 [Gaeumannomyces tritici R3-111a-1]|uniref:Major facilitator superfamily (MFS) profile domain-containing protein n=1 Tax=Gaeumannomyces tritici (strain R3-111a-1) TaxID=644352 RepID=J3NG54_GAET3|nr:hypothetical protein GGTG_00247 [Gaeumannomyces tritici R3-111a-1]EJT80244.1 hypothetical protein GGTG_00247 [Gaeumannomyces tritici R3-111a-1]
MGDSFTKTAEAADVEKKKDAGVIVEVRAISDSDSDVTPTPSYPPSIHAHDDAGKLSSPSSATIVPISPISYASFASSSATLAADDPPPNGGWAAWSQVVAGVLLNAVGWGFPATFGVFQAFYVSAQGLPASQVAWVGAVQGFLAYLLCVVSGRLSDAGYILSTVAAGTVLVALGTFTASLAQGVWWQIFLSQGLCTGLGLGMLTPPTLATINSHFDESKRSLAVTTATVGTSIGSIVFPAVVQHLIPHIGFAWAMRVAGFVALTFCLCALALLRPRRHQRLVEERKQKQVGSEPLIDIGALREVPFVCFVVSSFLFFVALYFAFFYINIIGEVVAGMAPTQSVALVMINSALGIPTRPLAGFVACRFKRLGPAGVFVISAVITGISVLCWAAATGPAGMYVFAAVFGLANGAAQGIWPAVLVALTPDPSRVGMRFGMLCAFAGLATLIGPPLAAAIVDASGGRWYLPAQIWAGSLAVVGGLIAWGSKTKPSSTPVEKKVEALDV